MHHAADADQAAPTALEHFDRNSGTWLERLVFNNRLAVLVVCALLTLVLGIVAGLKLTLNASFEKMIPSGHPYIQNYLEHRNDLRSLGNALRIVVENTGGDVYDPKYLDTLRKISDELVLTPGVDRSWVKSLWPPRKPSSVTSVQRTAGVHSDLTQERSTPGVSTSSSLILRSVSRYFGS